jgi:predicted acetyltransferase
LKEESFVVDLINVTENEVDVLHNLTQFYIYEFSKFIPSIILENHGLYKPFELDEYFTSPNKHAFFIKKDHELVGFALVQSECGGYLNNIDEFFIMRKHGGKGYGQQAASAIFNMFPGRWTVFQILANKPAQSFWRKAIRDFTNGEYSERTEGNKVIQEFLSLK